ncbi:hypothetical protein AGR7B_Lc50028 [Agrobacterium deltaense RV3]|nr:hypothetical protein AGR7B_Lc50028 [Agrobacterium deltaense RV3]
MPLREDGASRTGRENVSGLRLEIGMETLNPGESTPLRKRSMQIGLSEGADIQLCAYRRQTLLIDVLGQRQQCHLKEIGRHAQFQRFRALAKIGNHPPERQNLVCIVLFKYICGRRRHDSLSTVDSMKTR